jgi:hypothetical protein
LRTIIRPRVQNVVLLTVTAVNLLALAACVAMNLAMLVGAPAPPHVELYVLGLVVWSVLVAVLANGIPGGDFWQPLPRAYGLVKGLALLYFVLTSLLYARPPHPNGSAAQLAAHARADWRVATSYALLWLCALGFATLRACWKVHRGALPRARLAAYAARRGQP